MNCLSSCPCLTQWSPAQGSSREVLKRFHQERCKNQLYLTNGQAIRPAHLKMHWRALCAAFECDSHITRL